MRYLSFLLAVLISISVAGQANLLEKKGNLYFYKGQTYECSELDIVYKEHQESYDIYLSGLKSKNASYTVALLGIPFLVGGGLGLISAGFNPKIVGPLLLLSGGIIELIGLIIPKKIGNRKLRKAQSKFNHKMIEQHGYNSDASLLFGATENGLGFVFQF